MNTQKENNISWKEMQEVIKEIKVNKMKFFKIYQIGKQEGIAHQKAKAIELGNELIEEYFDKPSSVFWEKLKGELVK